MIDPKLNKLPVEKADDLEDTELSPEERAERLRRPQGLSINDTIAGGANLSVGSRGVDTSGVKSGSGAGAGMTSVTPGESGGSPAPNVVPGARGAGMTPRGSVGVDQTATTRLDARNEPSAEEISARANRCWHERGCPIGSPEVDWHRAEEELRRERQARKSAAATA
jgi:Protein of unknown function (DUF2934)